MKQTVTAFVSGKQAEKIRVVVDPETRVFEFVQKACRAAKESFPGNAEYTVRMSGCAVEQEEVILDLLAPGDEVEVILLEEAQKGLKRMVKAEEDGQDNDDLVGGEKKLKKEDFVAELKRISEMENVDGHIGKYVKPCLIEPEGEVEMDEIFEKGKRVVVQGETGMGKTSFFREIARLWIRGDIWKDRFDALIFIAMDQVELSDRTTLKSMLMDGLKEMKEPIEVFLNEERDWERVAWIFDGWEKTSSEGVLESIESGIDQRVKNVIFGTRPERASIISCDRRLRMAGLSERGKYDFLKAHSKHNVRYLLAREDWLNELCCVPSFFGIASKSNATKATKLLRDIVEGMLENVGTYPRKSLADAAFTCFKSESSEIEIAQFRNCNKDQKAEIEKCGLLCNGSFVHPAFISYLAAEYACFELGKSGEVGKLLLSLRRKNKFEKTELFFRCCCAIGGNVFACLDSWALKMPFSLRNLAIFEWMAEDETGKLAKYLKQNLTKFSLDFHACLLAAAKKGLFETCKFILDNGKGVDLNAGDENEFTVLMYACENGGSVELAKYLIQKGADIHRKTKKVHFAIFALT